MLLLTFILSGKLLLYGLFIRIFFIIFMGGIGGYENICKYMGIDEIGGGGSESLFC